MAPRVAIDGTRHSPDGALILRLAGELDLSDADAVRTALTEAVRANPAVVVDLSDLSFIDVAGMRALRNAYDAARSCGCRLQLAAPRPFIIMLATLMEFGPLPFCEDGQADGDGALSRPGRLADSLGRSGGPR
jgi:anti-anti-sigma factor